jgi:hypothetical protein
MKCCGGILALVILLLAIWPQILGDVASKWVIIIAAAILLIGAIAHICNCGCENCCAPDTKKAKTKRK